MSSNCKDGTILQIRISLYHQCAFIQSFTCIYFLVFASVLYLAEEVSLLLSLGEAGQVAADHQVRVIQHGIEPTPGGQQSLDIQDIMFTALYYMLSDVAKK